MILATRAVSEQRFEVRFSFSWALKFPWWRNSDVVYLIMVAYRFGARRQLRTRQICCVMLARWVDVVGMLLCAAVLENCQDQAKRLSDGRNVQLLYHGLKMC